MFAQAMSRTSATEPWTRRRAFLVSPSKADSSVCTLTESRCAFVSGNPFGRSIAIEPRSWLTCRTLIPGLHFSGYVQEIESAVHCNGPSRLGRVIIDSAGRPDSGCLVP